MRRRWAPLGLAIALLWWAGESFALVPEPWPAATGESRGRASLIAATWREGGNSLAERVEKTHRLALGLGASNVESAARWLIRDPSALDAREALERARHGRRLAPDLPIVHMAMARAQFRSGFYLASLGSLVEALMAIPRHLEARLWVEGMLGLIVTASLVAGSLFFITLMGLRAFFHAAHDLGDYVWPAMPGFARAALLACPGALFLVLGEGLMGLGLLWFGLGFAYARRGARVALVSAVVLLGAGLYGVSERAGRVLAALDADPLARAVYAVTREMDSPADRARLEAAVGHDPMAAHAWALEARRQGDDRAARARYEDILSRNPSDSLALANLGNLYFEQGDTREAIALYERSVAREPRASVLFNLSQAYAQAFEVVAFDRALAQAQKLDSARIDELSRRSEGGLVVDVPIAVSAIRGRLISTARGEVLNEAVRARFAPGWLGRDWLHGLLAYAAVALLSAFVATRFSPSSRCSRCGVRICTRCDGSVWNGRVCDACFGLFQKPGRTNPELRRRRVEILRRRERRLSRLDFWVRLAVPGWRSLGLERPVEGLLACVLIAVAALSLFWVRGLFPDPLVLGSAGSLALAAVGATALLFYVVLALGQARPWDRGEA